MLAENYFNGTTPFGMLTKVLICIFYTLMLQVSFFLAVSSGVVLL